MRTIKALHIVRDGQPLTAIQSGLPGQNEWLTNAELLGIARQLHELAIDGQRAANEHPRHPVTPNFLEFPSPSFDESASFDPIPFRDRLPIRPDRGGIDELSIPAYADPVGIDSEGGSHE